LTTAKRERFKLLNPASGFATWGLAACLAAAACSGEPGGDGGDDSETGGPGGGGDSTDSAIDKGQCKLGNRVGVRRLSRAEYANIIEDVLGVDAPDVGFLPVDEKRNGFDANLAEAIGQKEVQDLTLLAHELAVDSVSGVEKKLNCDLSKGSCREGFIKRYGRLFFRRQMTDDEFDAYEEVFKDKRSETDETEATRLVIEIMLQSPNTLYRVEDGEKEAKSMERLDGYSVASRLSFMLWASAPDDELLDAAEEGLLDDSKGIKKQVDRLMNDDRFERTLSSFHLQWLGMDGESPGKDPELYPDYTENTWKSAQEEAVRFAKHLYLKQDAEWSTLLDSEFGFPDEELSAIYDVDAPDKDFARTDLGGKRKGVMTQAGFLMALASDTLPSPIRRGVFIRKRLLCQEPPEAPEDAMFEVPEDTGATTQRERLLKHQEDPGCASCHAFFDPLGFAFERYGALGEFRTKENGETIKTDGVLTSTDLGEEVAFKDGVELAELLASSETARDCLPRQWVRYAVGRSLSEGSADSCVLETILERSADDDHRLMEIVNAVATSDFMRFRGPESENGKDSE